MAMASKAPQPTPLLRLPLSDKDLDLKAANKILASAQTREKFLKIVQYASKLFSYALLRGSAYKDLGKHFEALSKSLSTARRFFKFFRFMKHFEDVAEAREEQNPTFRSLLFIDILANLVADISEDLQSLVCTSTRISCGASPDLTLRDLTLGLYRCTCRAYPPAAVRLIRLSAWFSHCRKVR
eukprot:s4994_g5.t1